MLQALVFQAGKALVLLLLQLSFNRWSLWAEVVDLCSFVAPLKPLRTHTPFGTVLACEAGIHVSVCTHMISLHRCERLKPLC